MDKFVRVSDVVDWFRAYGHLDEHIPYDVLAIDLKYSVPAADVAPVRHGFWCWITEDIYRCDNCGEMSHVKEVMGNPDWKYCPNCGCLMDGGDDE